MFLLVSNFDNLKCESIFDTYFIVISEITKMANIKYLSVVLNFKLTIIYKSYFRLIESAPLQNYRREKTDICKMSIKTFWLKFDSVIIASRQITQS